MPVIGPGLGDGISHEFARGHAWENQRQGYDPCSREKR